ncbi:hypothetical protein ACNVED_05880 [Legionella sp. D16C41]|uniref:hypothetical protein n=1 Tax=Legionella sp. D16C41 TaxID=3402688 RepID=UPI003AF50557
MKSKLKNLAKNNYSFQLKCLAALATTAVVAIGIAAAISMKSAAVAAPTALLATTAAASAAPALFFALPFLLIAAGTFCLLPLLFRGCCGPSSRVYTNDYYTPSFGSSFFASRPSVRVDTPYYPSSNYFSSNHHGHESSGSASYPSSGGIFGSSRHGHSGSIASTNHHGHGGSYGSSSNHHRHR